MLRARPPIMTTHGLVAMSLYVKPLWNIALAERPIMPTPRPVCMKVSFKYARSNGGIPPSSRVSRLNIRLIARSVPPKRPPPIRTFCIKLPLTGCAIGCCIYVLDDLKAFRAFASVLTGVVVLEVKKFAAGLDEWNERMGAADLKIDFDATPSEEVSRNGCRIVKAILKLRS
jgi:hypothetical protein